MNDNKDSKLIIKIKQSETEKLDREKRNRLIEG